MFDAATFGIGCGIIEPRDPGMGDGAGAHCAWLQRDPQIAIIQPGGTENLGSTPDCDDFGMRSRIVAIPHGVHAGGNYAAPLDDESSDRHFPCLCRERRKIKCFTHETGEGKAHYLCHSDRAVLTKGAVTIRGAGFPE